MPTVAPLLAQASACLRAGQLRDAERWYREVLKLDSNNVDALYLLATAYHALGKPDEAVARLQHVVRIEPGHAESHNLLGALLLGKGDLTAAEGWLTRAIELKPDDAKPINNLGALFQRRGDFKAAAECYRRSLALQPDTASIYNNLGISLANQGEVAAAIDCYHRALELKPDYAEAHNNLGAALLRRDDFDAAADCFRRAIKLKPNYFGAHDNLGAVTQRQGNFAAAAESYRRTVELQPDLAEAHFNLAWTLLLFGNLEEGWREYEWRLKRPETPEEPLPQPRWTGSPLAGRTILLRCEQGMGDLVQFVRYAELIKRQGATVVVESPAPLVRLLASCTGVDRVVLKGRPLPEFDVHLPLLSLPWVFRTSLESIPVKIPYLSPEVELVELWRNELNDQRALKIGIAWQGNPTYTLDSLRSIPLAQFAGIAAMPGVRVYSLQLGPGREQLTEAADRWPIVDLGDRLGDFHNTAAIVRNLDLVITSDSAPAHLAGALGVPVWVALGFVPDWRWMIDRQDSPWYPTMRLFRQQRFGDWQDVFQRIEEELVKIVPNTGTGAASPSK